MARLITVAFAIPDDDPAADQAHLVKELQEQLYDSEGMAGSFKVVSNEPFDGNTATFGFDE